MTRTPLAALVAALGCAAALAVTPAVAEDTGRGIGYAAAGPVFHLPAGVSVERQEIHISIYSVRLAHVFKSATRRTEWTATNHTPGGETGIMFFARPDPASASERK